MKFNLKLLSFFMFLFFISCSHQKTDPTRDIAQEAKILGELLYAEKTVFRAGTKVQSDIFKSQIEKAIEVHASNLDKLKINQKASLGKIGEEAYSARRLKNGSFEIFAAEIKKAQGTSYRMTFRPNTGNLSNFIAANKNHYGFNHNYSVYSPGSAETAEVGRSSGQVAVKGSPYGKPSAGCNLPGDAVSHARTLASSFKDGGCSEAEQMIVSSLDALEKSNAFHKGFDKSLVNAACNKLSDESKETVAIILDDLSKAPQINRQALITSYAKIVGLSDKEEAEQLLKIMSQLNCGLDIAALE